MATPVFELSEGEEPLQGFAADGGVVVVEGVAEPGHGGLPQANGGGAQGGGSHDGFCVFDESGEVFADEVAGGRSQLLEASDRWRKSFLGVSERSRQPRPDTEGQRSGGVVPGPAELEEPHGLGEGSVVAVRQSSFEPCAEGRGALDQPGADGLRVCPRERILAVQQFEQGDQEVFAKGRVAQGRVREDVEGFCTALWVRVGQMSPVVAEAEAGIQEERAGEGGDGGKQQGEDEAQESGWCLLSGVGIWIAAAVGATIG